MALVMAHKIIFLPLKCSRISAAAAISRCGLNVPSMNSSRASAGLMSLELMLLSLSFSMISMSGTGYRLWVRGDMKQMFSSTAFLLRSEQQRELPLILLTSFFRALSSDICMPICQPSFTVLSQMVVARCFRLVGNIVDDVFFRAGRDRPFDHIAFAVT